MKKSSLNFKEKVEYGLFNVKVKAKRAKDWITQHPKETIVLVTLGISGLSEIRKTGERIQDRIEENRNRTSVYCNDVQGRVRLKHELNYKENSELRDRMNGGQTKFEALRDMNLLR